MKIAIAGAGKLGVKVAEALMGGNHDITIIDKDNTILQKLSSQIDIMTVNGNAKQIINLQKIGIENYDYLLAATDTDEKNIFIASCAKKLGCGKVMARIRDPEHFKQVDFIRDNMGIDYIINPDYVITMEIYKYLAEKYTLSNGIFSSGKVSLLEFQAARMKKLHGHTMMTVGEVLPGMLVVAIDRSGKIIVPHGSTDIRKDDRLYVIGERAAVMALNSKVHERGKWTDLQKVMIIGGGKTGLYLASRLADFGAQVKIVERDKERCQYLASRLDNVMILHGDATDLTFLEEENIDGMDALVTATGFDEENLMLALLGKKRGVEDVIAKVSRESYASIVESIGIDMALNPLNITAANILGFIRGEKRVLSTQMIQGQAEIMEIIADERMKLVNTPLKDMRLPDGLLICAIHRGGSVIIPRGDTVIKKGDKVIILCLLSELQDMEKLTSTEGMFAFFK